MSNVRVMIVDDAAPLRRLFAAVIDRHDQGWSVAGEAANGLEAIERAAGLRPDLVLLDLSMPVMDGLEALPELRQRVPEAAVVVLTGFPTPAVEEAVDQGGAHGCLAKDDVVNSLIPRLEAILDRLRAQQREAAAE